MLPLLRFRPAIFMLSSLFWGVAAAFGQTLERDPATGKSGFVDMLGHVVVPFDFQELPQKYDTLMAAKKGGKYGVINGKGETLVPFEYQNLRLSVKPHGHQHGFAIVSKTAGNRLGIINQKGELVLPMQYNEHTHALGPDLLVGCEPGDTMLQFFNGRGQLLYKIPGRRAYRGFDENSMQIERNDRKMRYADLKTGAWIFPERLADGAKWTDGRFIIYGDYRHLGLITVSGDTVLPFEFSHLSPTFPGQFRVGISGENGIEQGVVDEAGQYVIPLGRWEIWQYEGLYRACDIGGAHDCALYSPGGQQILPMKYQIREIPTHPRPAAVPMCRPEKYLAVQQREQPYLRGVFAANGKAILPIAYSGVYYYAETHPLIAWTDAEYPKKKACMAFDLTGKPLLARPYVVLTHTPNPRILVASRDGDGLSGFLNLDGDTAHTAFIYKNLSEVFPGVYVAQRDSQFVMVTSEGKELHVAPLGAVKFPNREETKRFAATAGTSGKLVVVMPQPPGAPSGTWIGFNHEGKAFTFEPPAVPSVGSGSRFGTGRVGNTNPTPKEVEEVAEMVAMPAEKVEEMVVEAPPPPYNEDERIWEITEEVALRPQFPGGEEALQKFIRENLRYPSDARAAKIQGKTYIEFVVEKDGALRHFRVKQSLYPSCDAASYLLFRQMPRWIPGKVGSRPARCRVVVPVEFRLND